MEDFFKSGDGEETDGAQSVAKPDSGGSVPTPPDGAMPDFGGSDDDSGGGRRGGFDLKGFDFNGAFGGMGSSDVKLQYTDDDPDSYSNIFNNAKTDVSSADQARLIESLKTLGEGTDVERVVDVEQVIRYFVVHNFVCNGDSYTGSIVHNYYLHESDGRLSMIPWDYNLAFGTFQGADATGTVNDPIDSPMSVSDASDRPMWGWIVSNEEYAKLYHERFAEFLDTVDVVGVIDEAYGLIKSYVEKDPTAFCAYDEFEAGVETLRQFCALRAQSVRGQLDGTIPSTDEGQNADRSAFIDASFLTLSDMGSMGGGMGGPGGGSGGGHGKRPDGGEDGAPNGFRPEEERQASEDGGERPSGFPNAPSGGQSGGMPDFLSAPGGNGFPDGGFSDGGASASSLTQRDWITLAACAAVLCLGIVFAKKYRVAK